MLERRAAVRTVQRHARLLNGRPAGPEPKRLMKGAVGINDDTGLEREADAMGAKAGSLGRAGTEALAAGAGGSPPALRPGPNGSAPVQGVFVYDNKKTMSSRAYDKIKRALEDDPTLPDFTKHGAFEADPVSFTKWLSGIVTHMANNSVVEHVTLIYAVDAERSESAEDPVEKIKKADLSKHAGVSLSGSRSKIVFLFKADGEPTTKKNEARYAIDSQMDKNEYDRLRLVESFGLRIPAMYGTHDKGVILEWIPSHGTAGGGGGKPLVTMVSKSIELDGKLNRPFNKLKWERTLQDVDKLIAAKFTSKDLQFMVDDASGRIYMMDFDSENIPSFQGADKRLTDLRTFLQKALASQEIHAPAKTERSLASSESQESKKQKTDDDKKDKK